MSTNTTYQKIIDLFYPRITSYDFAKYADEDTLNEVVSDYLFPALMDVKSTKIDVDLSDRDDTLGEFNFELSDELIDSIVGYMVVEWMNTNFIYNQQVLESKLTSTDFRSLNIATILDKVITARDECLARLDQKCIENSYKKNGIESLINLVKKR